MNKRKLTILTIISFIVLAILFFNISTKNKEENFNNLICSDDEYNNIILNRSKSSKPIVSEIRFDNNALFYDDKNNKLYYSLIEGSDTAYNPEVTWNNEDIKIAIEKKTINNDLISNSESIKVLTYSKNDYYEYELICTTLPLLNINVFNSYGLVYGELMTLITDYKKMDMKSMLFDNSAKANERLVAFEGKIKVRGNGTLQFPKKGFKINIEKKEVEDNKQEDISLLGMSERKEYVLYAGYNDPERIRNVFSSNLWNDSCAKNNSFDIENGFQYKFLELFLNNEYWGLYALGYSVDEKTEDIRSINGLQENIFKKNTSLHSEYDFDFIDISNNGYELRTTSNGNEAWKQLGDFYYKLFNSNNSEELYDLVDIDNSIDIYLFVNLIQGVDHAASKHGEKQWLYNLFLTTKIDGNKLKMLYCPWDMDRTWGKGFEDEIEAYDIDYDRNAIMENCVPNILLEQEDSKIKEMIRGRYLYLRSNEWSDDSLINILDEYEKQIFDSGAFYRDVNKWDKSANIGINNKLSIFRNYVLKRVNYFDTYIDEITK